MVEHLYPLWRCGDKVISKYHGKGKVIGVDYPYSCNEIGDGNPIVLFEDGECRARYNGSQMSWDTSIVRTHIIQNNNEFIPDNTYKDDN